VARPRPTALLSPISDGKPEAATAVVELLMMDVRTPETCRAVHKCQVINLRNIASSWLIYLKCMMMHGLANFKSRHPLTQSYVPCSMPLVTFLSHLSMSMPTYMPTCPSVSLYESILLYVIHISSLTLNIKRYLHIPS